MNSQNSFEREKLLYSISFFKVQSDSLNTKNFIQVKDSRAIVKYNPISLFFIGMMKLYQEIISPVSNSNCIYERSCSNFSKGAISEYGLVKGILLSADRLMRCTPGTFKETPSYLRTKDNHIHDEPGRYQVK